MHDVLIIGGGLIGMLSARELALQGANVRLIEQGEVGRESSWAGGGILSPLYPWRYPDGVTELARWSQQHYPSLLESLHKQTGIDPQHTESGLLFLDGMNEKDEAISWAFRFGYQIELLRGAGTVRGCEPALADGFESALWMPDMGQVRNPRLLQAVRADLIARGVEIGEQTKVERLLASAGRITGVETSAGTIMAERVVVAAGAWSGALLGDLGEPLPVRPVRGQMLLYHAEPGLLSRIVLQDYHYLIPRSDGRVLVGSTLEVEAGFDKETTQSAHDELRALVRQLVPQLDDYPIERHWAGLRPGSPEGVPFIGEHPEVDGLFINSGHFRNGVVMGYASARLLSELVLGHQTIIDPAPYAIQIGRTRLH